MKRSLRGMAIGVWALVGVAVGAGCLVHEDVGSADDAGSAADAPGGQTDAARLTADARDDSSSAVDASSPTPEDGSIDAEHDASTGDAGAIDAGSIDSGAIDSGAIDAGSPVVLVDGSTYPVLGFDFNDTTLVYRDSRGFHTCPLEGCASPVASYTTLALALPVRFTVSGARVLWVSVASPATTFEIRSLDAATLTLPRKENLLYCTSVQSLRAEASSTIATYRASSSPLGSSPQSYTLAGTPNLSRTGVATEGHCVATGCRSATHTYAIVGGSIVRTPL